MVKKIVYIGSKLAKNGNTPTGIDILEPLLQEFFDLKCVSDKKNKLSRMFDYVFTIISKKNTCDLILIDTYSTLNFYYALLCSLLAQSLGIPYILLLRGGDLENRLKNNRFLSKLLFKKASKLISPSTFLKNVFKKYGYPVYVLPTPINDKFFTIESRIEYQPKLLWVRKFHSIYNPQMAIRLLKVLEDELANVKLVMIGPEIDGSLKKCEVLAAKLDVSDKVDFLGLINKKDLIQYYSESDIFINTTNIDNTPLSVLEAMASSLAIVSTKVGGIKYMLNHNTAYLVEVNNEFEMSNNIIDIIHKQQKVQTKVNKAKTYAEKFRWGFLKNQWKQIINDIK